MIQSLVEFQCYTELCLWSSCRMSETKKFRYFEAKSKKAVVIAIGIEQSPGLSCLCSASDPRQLNQRSLNLTTSFVIFISEHPNFIIILLHTNWYLFAYSRFAYSCFVYFRPKSSVSPTCKQNYIWTSKWCQTRSWSRLVLENVFEVTSWAVTGFVCTKSCIVVECTYQYRSAMYVLVQ